MVSLFDASLLCCFLTQINGQELSHTNPSDIGMRKAIRCLVTRNSSPRACVSQEKKEKTCLPMHLSDACN